MFTNKVVKHIYKQIKLLKTFFMTFIHLIAQFASNFFLPSFLFDESEDIKGFLHCMAWVVILEETRHNIVNVNVNIKP